MHEVALELCRAACVKLRVLAVCLVSVDTALCVGFCFFFYWLSHIVMSSTRRHAEGMPDSYARQIAAGRGSRVRMPWKNIKKMFTVVRKSLMFFLEKTRNNMFMAFNLQLRVNIAFGFFFNRLICIKKKIER